jgi:hypothetical protein
MNIEELRINIFGLRWLYTAMIPWALALGAIGWLGFYMAFHEDRKELSQEERRAIYVGAGTRPHAKIEVILDASNECVEVKKVDYDAPELVGYIQNHCRDAHQYARINWALVSPDGTSLRNGSDYCPAMVANGKSECKAKTKYYGEDHEDRAASIHVWVTE